MPRIIRRKSQQDILSQRQVRKAVDMLKILHRGRIVQTQGGQHVIVFDAEDKTEWDSKVRP